MKEWKSYANLHAFDTENVAIVEGLIWTAIAAAALKRFLAYMTQLLAEVPMSKQHLQNTRRNTLPVKLVDGALLMCHKYLACALV